MIAVRRYHEKFVLALLFLITALVAVLAIYLDRLAPDFSGKIHPNRNSINSISIARWPYRYS